MPLPDRLASELLEWRNDTKWQGDDNFIFPNCQGGFMDYENFEARVLDPIRQKLGLAKLNFQVLRRSFATLAYGERKGTLKDVQKQLRHKSRHYPGKLHQGDPRLGLPDGGFNVCRHHWHI